MRHGTVAGIDLRVLMLTLTFIACSEPGMSDDGGPDVDAEPIDAGDVSDTGLPDTGLPPVAFSLTSSAFGEGDAIPLRHECGPPAIMGPGENITPPLEWTSGPPETLSYAVVVRDVSAGGLVHWVLYDIPGSAREVTENVAPAYEPAFPAGAKQAQLQGSGYFGYLGPCSTGTSNTYRWTLHALDTATLPGVDMATTENAMAAAVEAASIASASLSGQS